MRPTGGSVASFLTGVTPAKRRRDAEALTALLQEVSGREPELWGTIVGLGSCHYRYPTGTEGDMPLLAFAPRKAASTLYLESTAAHADDLARLGPHSTGVGCLYIKDLEEIDLDVLRGILTASLRWAESGGDEHAVLTVTG
ncbi:MAG: hypothetical protein BGN97_08865 [Microbacterium sp. 69-10]|uniref:DUF1801 domain-containing protein n=1 Tax=Microbacterium sp. 69-10 TaxID=1895783 RepID=UPI00096709A0|nr:DUF1801 domain-containing protein [Microbacterium sp. 69-10]OJU42455.1 MAG: hypothetical protein BGN97_08865 [Microbacterium sp. 69-10]